VSKTLRMLIAGMEHALRMCVLTHPAPDNLADAWGQLLPTIAAKHMDSSALFTAAFQQSLTVLTEQIGEVRCR
jgi:hypothetical protein